MTKKLIKETVEVDLYQFEGSLEDIIAMLQDWKEECKWEGIELDEYYESCSYKLYKHREETDYEYEMRMKEIEKQNRQKVKEKEKRRIQYEMLKKEFEDT
jgi:hypothetical protein